MARPRSSSKCLDLHFVRPPLLTHTSRVPETLPAEVLTAMHAPPKPNYPIIKAKDLPNYDGYLLGIPTRYGNFPGQWKVHSVEPNDDMYILIDCDRPFGIRQAHYGDLGLS